MSKTVSRVLWVLAGAALIVAGVVCLIRPGVALSSASLLLGIVMLFSGILIRQQLTMNRVAVESGPQWPSTRAECS